MLTFQGSKSGCSDYSQLTMPSRRCGRNRGFYSPIRTDIVGDHPPVIYAKVNKKGKKFHQQRGHENELNIFNTSSESSIRDGDCDAVSAETPLVTTSDDGRSSSNSDEAKYNRNEESGKMNKMNTIQYDDRESQV